jgi:mRNA interferase RelE/StbE
VNWRLAITPSAERDLSKLDRQTLTTVRSKLEALLPMIEGSHQPPPGTKRLRHTTPETWRLRVGDWRVLYRIDRSARAIIVHGVKHRSEMYER